MDIDKEMNKQKNQTWYQNLGSAMMILSLAIAVSSFLIALSILFFKLVGII